MQGLAFKLNFKYFFWIFYNKNTNFKLKSKALNNLLTNFLKLILFYYKKFFILKNSLNKLIMKVRSLENIPFVEKFDSIVNS